MNEFEPQVVILGGGDYPSHDIPQQLLQGAERVLCCDGAVYGFLRNGGKPWRIVGDCDSINNPPSQADAALLEPFKDLVRHNPDQETNDQTKAVKYCQEHGFTRLAIVGGTGRREDHTLGNISLLATYLQMGLDVRMYTDHGVFIPCRDTFTATLPLSTQISIFNISARDFTSEGLRYPLYDFTQLWQGTLNENTTPEIKVLAHGIFLIYLCYSK